MMTIADYVVSKVDGVLGSRLFSQIFAINIKTNAMLNFAIECNLILICFCLQQKLTVDNFLRGFRAF